MPIQMLTSRSAQDLFTPTASFFPSPSMGEGQGEGDKHPVDKFTSPSPLPSGERAGVRGSNHPLMASLFEPAFLKGLDENGEPNFNSWLAGIAILLGVGGGIAFKLWRDGKKTGDIFPRTISPKAREAHNKVRDYVFALRGVNPDFIDNDTGKERSFETRKDLDKFLKGLGYTGEESEAGEVKVLRNNSDGRITVNPQMDGGMIYKVSSAVVFDKDGKQVNVNDLGEGTNYDKFEVRYSFDKDGSLKSWDVRRIEISTSSRQGMSLGQVVWVTPVSETTLFSSGDPIRDLPVRDLEILKAYFPDLKTKYPQATDEHLEGLAISEVKAWFALPLETRKAEDNKVLASYGSPPRSDMIEDLIIYSWVIKAIEKRLQAEGPEGLKTAGGDLKVMSLGQESLKPGKTFFEDLFRPLTVPELKVSHPGAETFMATVTEILGKDGKVDPAVETLDGLNALLRKQFPNARSTEFTNGSETRWRGNIVRIETAVYTSTRVDKAVEYLSPGDGDAQSKSGEILPANTVLIISQGFNAQGNPVVEDETNMWSTNKTYTFFETRLHYNNNKDGRLTNVILRKRNDVFYYYGFNIGPTGARPTQLLTKMDGAGNVSWPAGNTAPSPSATTPSADGLPSPQRGEGAENFRIKERLPEGAIDPVVLLSPASTMSSPRKRLPAGSVAGGSREIPASAGMTEPNELKPFETLDALQQHLNDSFGARASIDDVTFWRGNSAATIDKYITALGETVVIIPSENIFDKEGKAAGTAAQFDAHRKGGEKLPAGEYSQYQVQYYFDRDGAYKGIAVERTTIDYILRDLRNMQAPNGYDGVHTERLAEFDSPGQALSRAKANEYVETLKKKLAGSPVGEGLSPLPEESGRPQRAAPTELQEAVVTALKDWFSMKPDVRREITRLLAIDKSMIGWDGGDIDRIDPDWVTSRATAHLEGRGNTLFSTFRVNDTLQVTNAGIVFVDKKDRESFMSREVFSLGNSGEGFPPEALVSSLAIELRKRVALGNIPLKRLKEAVRAAIGESGHNIDVVGPKYEHKGTSPTLPVIVNGRTMELQTGGIEWNVRRSLFPPARVPKTGWEKFFERQLGERVRLGNAVATEFIPRAQLPEFAMEEDGNIKKFETLAEFLTDTHKRLGLPSRTRDEPLQTRRAWQEMMGKEWLAMRSWSQWPGIDLYELKDGHGGASFVEWAGVNRPETADIPFPEGDIRFVVRVAGNLYDSRGHWADHGLSEKYYPHAAHDVFYFFGQNSELVSAMVVNRVEHSYGDEKGTRTILRMDTPEVVGRVSYNDIVAAREKAAARQEKMKDVKPFVQLAYQIGDQMMRSAVPDGAIHDAFLESVEIAAGSNLNTLKQFPTLAEMEPLLVQNFGKAETDKAGVTNYGKGGVAAKAVTQLGDTVVEVSNDLSFDEDGKAVSAPKQGVIYNDYSLRYYFDADGKLKGIAVDVRDIEPNCSSISGRQNTAVLGERRIFTYGAPSHTYDVNGMVRTLTEERPKLDAKKLREDVIIAFRSWDMVHAPTMDIMTFVRNYLGLPIPKGRFAWFTNLFRVHPLERGAKAFVTPPSVDAQPDWVKDFGSPEPGVYYGPYSTLGPGEGFDTETRVQGEGFAFGLDHERAQFLGVLQNKVETKRRQFAEDVLAGRIKSIKVFGEGEVPSDEWIRADKIHTILDERPDAVNAILDQWVKGLGPKKTVDGDAVAGEKGETLATARAQFLDVLQTRAAGGAAPLLSADKLARIKDTIKTAYKGFTEGALSFTSGNVENAFDTFVRLTDIISGMPELSGDTPVAKALKWLKAAAHEAASDMARLSQDAAKSSSHYAIAYSIIKDVRPGDVLTFTQRMMEASNKVDGYMTVNNYWREVGIKGFFDGPLAELDGGTITPKEMERPAVDIAAPEVSAVRAEAQTKELLRTRREILDAHREALRDARKGREK